jgi:hypothetical protein
MDPLSIAAEIGAVATAATAATEVTAVVAGAASAVSGATEAASVASAIAGAATIPETAAMGALHTSASLGAEVFANTPAAVSVADLATGALASPDMLAGERAIQALLELPDELGASSALSGAEALAEPTTNLSTTSEQIAQMKTESSLQKWDLENPKPDPKTQPAEYKQWCEKRDVVETDYIIDSKSELAMKEWDEKNPEPNKETDPEKHKAWEEKRAKDGEKLKEQIKEETQKLKQGEKENIIAELNRLRELYMVRMDIVEGIRAMKNKGILTDEQKVTLATFQERKLLLDSEIRLIETDLKQRQALSNPLIGLTIATALIAMSVYKIGQQEGLV